MAYRFKLHESLEDGVRRIALDQIERASVELAPAEIGGTAIHETRKCLKRLRALLRLVRPGLGDRVFRRENTRLRNIAQALSPARDVDILPAAAAKLEGMLGGEKPPALDILRAVLSSHTVTALPLKSQSLKDAKDAVQGLHAKFKKLPLKDADFSVVEQGLRDAARNARRTYAEAYVLQSDEAFHEWRKCVQLHWRHMQLLARAWPEMFEARIGTAKHLSQLLGDEHDLSVLEAFANNLPESKMPQPDRAAALGLIEARKVELRAAAAPLGLRLHAERPKAFAASIGEIWKAARAADRLPAGITGAGAAAAASREDLEKVPAE